MLCNTVWNQTQSVAVCSGERQSEVRVPISLLGCLGRSQNPSFTGTLPRSCWATNEDFKRCWLEIYCLVPLRWESSSPKVQPSERVQSRTILPSLSSKANWPVPDQRCPLEDHKSRRHRDTYRGPFQGFRTMLLHLRPRDCDNVLSI